MKIYCNLESVLRIRDCANGNKRCSVIFAMSVDSFPEVNEYVIEIKSIKKRKHISRLDILILKFKRILKVIRE